MPTIIMKNDVESIVRSHTYRERDQDLVPLPVKSIRQFYQK